MPKSNSLDQAFAKSLDDADPLARFRQRFYMAPGTIYLDGNSLGLLSRDAESSILDALESWKTLGVTGWTEANPPWFTLAESLGARLAAFVGASPDSVIVTGSTTVNLHQMIATFYRPEGNRRKIVATSLDFPSDVYAFQSEIRLRGGNIEEDLVLVASSDGRMVDEEDIIAAITDEVALVVLPSVLYRSGQLLDMKRLTAVAHERGVLIGFDCAHSVGAMPHAFDDWDIDFAVWCSYKYLNAGPGGVGALYVNARHFGREPALAGWWGYRKDRQFDMAHEWEGAPDAGAFQISTVPLLSTVALQGSLDIFEEAGIDAIRAKSLELTDYLISLIEGTRLDKAPFGYGIGTPLDHAKRGGHVAVEHEAASAIALALKARGIIVDFRPPNVIRIAPIALYTTFADIWQTVQALGEIVHSNEYLNMKHGGLVT